MLLVVKSSTRKDRLMIRLESSGNFDNTERFLKNAKNNTLLEALNRYGREGVEALSAATPAKTGRTATSWTYKIENTPSGYTIHWENTNINKNVNIAVIIQYGHGTKNGGYVQGIDYINPAMRPVFENIANEVWREVTK